MRYNTDVMFLNRFPLSVSARAGRVIVLLCLIGWLAEARGGLGPQNVVVVVNADSWASVTVANEYIRLRQIPSCNILYLHLRELPDFEQVGIEPFRQKILFPVLQELEKRNLAGQISCIAWSSDIPYAVNVAADTAGAKLPQAITPWGSLNGLTYLFRPVLAKQPVYLALNNNLYAPPVLVENELHLSEIEQLEFQTAAKLFQSSKWSEAQAIFARLAKSSPENYHIQYNLACCLVHMNQHDNAMIALARAVAAGYWNRGEIRYSEHLKPLWDRKDFQQILGKIQPPPVNVPPVVGFDATSSWTPEGRKIPGQFTGGYLLSTMLGVTSGRGNSVREVQQYLQRSAQADGTQPKGTIYYLTNHDVRSTARDWGFTAAAEKLHTLGVNAIVEEGVLPKKRDDVAGAMVGAADFSWPVSGSKILPGAICEHFTSCGGMMAQGNGQTPLTEFLRYGASGASGTVTEPYALHAKFPNAFIQYYYAQGLSLAEAFYRSVSGPYQLLIVGDPMCRPWARIPQVKIGGIEPGATIKDTVSIKPEIVGSAAALDQFELYVDGRRVMTCRAGESLSLDTNHIVEGYHEVSVVAVLADAVQTQGAATVAVRVRNTDDNVSLLMQTPTKITWGEPIKLEAGLATGKRLVLLANSQEVAAIEGEQGKVEIDSRRLGFGTVRLQAIGLLNKAGTTQPVLSDPIPIQIAPPAGPARLTPPHPTSLTPGLLVRSGTNQWICNQGPFTEQLAKFSLKPNEPFTMEGYFDVPTEDWYQIQVRCSGTCEIQVNGQVLATVSDDNWNYLPVTLSMGLHHLRISVKPKGTPSLDVRLGAAGVYTLHGERFKHIKIEPTATSRTVKP